MDKGKIIKGLECCSKLDEGACDCCPYEARGCKAATVLIREALELIKADEEFIESVRIQIFDKLREVQQKPEHSDFDNGVEQGLRMAYELFT